MSKIESIVIHPGFARVFVNGVEVPLRTAQRLDDFAVTIGARLRVPAYVREREALPHRTIIVCDPDVLEAMIESGHATMAWVVAIDENPKDALRRAEALGLAAVVDEMDYQDWVDGAGRPAALFGRKELAERIGASADPTEYRFLRVGPRYARMTRDGDLPTLLADYLAAYAESYLLQP